MMRVNRLLRLSPWDWVMLVAAYRWLIWARWQMRSGHLVGWEWLEGNRPRQARMLPVSTDAGDPRIRRRARLIELAARYPRRWSLCLQSSLALREWLAQSRIYADLRIGVQKSDEQLLAHAWLEYQGEVLNDDRRSIERFVTLDADLGKLLGQVSDASWETVK